MNKVYIVFGDEARSDGDNILGIFNTRKSAENYINNFPVFRYSISIEEHEVME